MIDPDEWLNGFFVGVAVGVAAFIAIVWASMEPLK